MKLKKSLGYLDVMSIASGAMISSGLFILPSIAYKEVGPAIILSYLIASILMLPTIYSELELATAMPKAGGDYFFIGRALGTLGGTVGGISNWFFISFKTAFSLVGIGIFAKMLFPELTILQMKLISVLFTVIFVGVNLISAELSGKLEVLLVIFLFFILGIYIIKGIPEVNVHNLDNFLEKGWDKVFATAGMVFISYGGITTITSLAEEIKNPIKTLPRALLSAYIIVSILYTLTLFVTVGVIDGVTLSNSNLPLSEVAGRPNMFGQIGFVVLSLGALLAFLTTANAGILAASRFPAAMGRDGILPKVLAKTSKKNKVPYASILLTGFIMLGVVFLDVKELAKTASTLMLLSFIFINLSVIIMRESKISSYRPNHKTSLYPYIQIIGIIFYIILILEMGVTSISISLLFVLVTVVWYFSYVKSRVSHTSALMYIIRRITSKELIDDSLDNELKEIIYERDEIEEDRFDEIIKETEIIDLSNEELINYEELFEMVSEKISSKNNLDKDKIKMKLMEREKESPTVIKTGVAIPHVIIYGEKIFDIIVVRSKVGIDFSLEDKIVNVAFFLVGTKDERNFHLKALMSIAQIVSNEEFDNNWLSAKTETELRNIILLAERNRVIS